MIMSNRELPSISHGSEAGDNEGGFHSGANWFYWIAGLSLVNTILLYTGSEWVFVVGLGVTQLIDGIAIEIARAFSVASSFYHEAAKFNGRSIRLKQAG